MRVLDLTIIGRSFTDIPEENINDFYANILDVYNSPFSYTDLNKYFKGWKMEMMHDPIGYVYSQGQWLLHFCNQWNFYQVTNKNAAFINEQQKMYNGYFPIISHNNYRSLNDLVSDLSRSNIYLEWNDECVDILKANKNPFISKVVAKTQQKDTQPVKKKRFFGLF